MSAPRVVVTGTGWITPLGHDIESVWRRLLAGESGMAPITRFDARTFPTTFAAEVRDYDVSGFVRDPAVHATAGLNSQFALGAASQAWRQAGLDRSAPRDPRRVGLYLGAGEGVLDTPNYVGTNLEAWDAAAGKVDGSKEITEETLRAAGLVRGDRKSTRLNSSHSVTSRMPSSA